MVTYKTPGVYVEEIATLPPSVAEVATAIPAFIGYTEKGAKQVKLITTLLEYEETVALHGLRPGIPEVFAVGPPVDFYLQAGMVRKTVERF